MALEYRVLNWGDEVATERVALWENAERITATTNGRSIDIIGTDESVDRHNTKILVDGWQLDDYRNNPVLLWSHNMDPAVSTMPIGRIIGIYRETYARASDAKVGKRLVFRAEFPEEGIYPFADLVHKMYAGKFLRASSVGFRNIKSRRLDPTNDEDKKIIEQDGFDAKHPYGASVLEKNALMELSAVPVGSNPNALAKALRDSAPEAHRALVTFTAETVVDDEWIAERFELLREALAPVPAPVVVKDADDEEVSAEPTELQKTLLKQVVDNMKRELELRAFGAVLEPVTADLREVKTQIESLRVAIAHLTDRIADLGGAERVADEESIAPAPADPWDVLLGENEEALRRISSLLK